eukprot:SAG31_NODE_32073_length_360_cov_0.984674_1_plen_29_part_10
MYGPLGMSNTRSALVIKLLATSQWPMNKS